MTAQGAGASLSSSRPSWSELLRAVAARNGTGSTDPGWRTPQQSDDDKKKEGGWRGDDSGCGGGGGALFGAEDAIPSHREEDDDLGNGERDDDGAELREALARQLRRYASDVLRRQPSPGSSNNNNESWLQHRRATIRDTRLALRFGLAWVASLASAEDGRERNGLDMPSGTRCRRGRLQRSLLESTEASLYRILLSDGRARSGGEGGDRKCRLYAARLLCNLVTDNAGAARRVLHSSLRRLDPGQEALLDRQRRGILCREEDGDENGEEVSDEEADRSPNWLDMIVNNGDDRDALAAIVATLHNAIAAAEPPNLHFAADHGTVPRFAEVTEDEATSSCFSRELASHGPVMNALLRQVVSSQSIVSHAPNDPSIKETTPCPLDDASDWILVLVRGLVRRGYLRAMYGAVSGNVPSDASAGTEAGRGYHALPEHVVLLFCLRQQLESETGRGPPLLVRLCDSATDALDTVVFLADLYADLSAPEVSSPPAASDSTSRMERVSVQLRALDLLCELLQDDSNSGGLDARARSAVGRHPSFVHQLSRDLAALVDTYSQQTLAASDGPASEPAPPTGRRVTIPPLDQERLTSTVRLLGNLCYRCRHNQDLLRSIAVPSTAAASSSSASPQSDRNVLHVLMTSTSLAPYCFTLREWAVVAIRNALEDNAENQSVLADLQAQQPASSAALSDMGVRIDLDAATGRVSVVPMDDDANSGGST